MLLCLALTYPEEKQDVKTGFRKASKKPKQGADLCCLGLKQLRNIYEPDVMGHACS